MHTLQSKPLQPCLAWTALNSTTLKMNLADNILIHKMSRRVVQVKCPVLFQLSNFDSTMPESPLLTKPYKCFLTF